MLERIYSASEASAPAATAGRSAALGAFSPRARDTTATLQETVFLALDLCLADERHVCVVKHAFTVPSH